MKIKQLLQLLFFFISFSVSSQVLLYKELLPPNSQELSDLTFLDEELSDVKLVLLGEMTHDFGTIFQMKIRFIKYMHQNLGFNTIAMEAPIYDIWKRNQNGFTADGFTSGIFDVWAKSDEFQELVQYIEKNNIKVMGFDSQFNDEISVFIDDFIKKLKEVNFKLHVDEDDFAIQLDNVLERFAFDNDVLSYKEFSSQMDKIINHFGQLPSDDSHFYWKQFSKSVKAGADEAFFDEAIQTAYYGNKDFNYRDKQMADNLLSYMERFPEEKIMVWADNMHCILDVSTINQPVIKDFVAMGTYLKKALHNKVYSIATLHGNDSIRIPRGMHKIEIPQNSMEYQLKKVAKPYLFLKADQAFLQTDRPSKILHYYEFDTLQHPKLFDAYVFLEKASFSTYVRSQMLDTLRTTSSNNSTAIRDVVNNTKVKNDKLVTYQLLDAKTLSGIPFVSIYFEKEKVFLESDKDGFFTIDVTHLLSKNATATITSLGYEKRMVPLEQFDTKIHLIPQEYLLDEVVLEAKLSVKKIMKKTIQSLRTNHPDTPFNFHRLSKITRKTNDSIAYDYSFINKEYDMGYFSPYTNTTLYEHIKWHVKPNEDNLKKMTFNLTYRENAIQYGTFFNKRKMKHFDFVLEDTYAYKNHNVYVVRFTCKKKNWSYTNQSYPATYYGKIYINKEDFAVLKVEEHWEATLDQLQIKQYFKEAKNYRQKDKIIIKDSQICDFETVFQNKYYASRFKSQTHRTVVNVDGSSDTLFVTRDSKTYNYIFNNIETIEHKKSWAQKLSDVTEDSFFWGSFNFD